MSDPVTLMAGVLQEFKSMSQAAGGLGSPGMDGLASGASLSPGGAADFLATLKDAVGRADGAVAASETNATRFAAGDDGISLSDVMVSLEKANLSLQTVATVRDRAVDAYQTIMNMQV